MQTNQTPKWLDLFITAFGTQGLIALAWWAGAFHAKRIRELQATYPILQITGGAGVGKSTLVANLMKMAGSEVDCLNADRCTMSALLSFLARAVNRPVVLEESEHGNQSLDLGHLKGCYHGGTIGVRGTVGQPESHNLVFEGALAFVGCEFEVINSRIVNIHLQRLSHTDSHRAAVDALHALQITEMAQFVEAVRANREQVIYRLGHVPAYAESLRKETAPGLNHEIARNHAQLRALLDLLADLFPIPADVMHHAHTEVCGMAWVHADSKPTEAPTN